MTSMAAQGLDLESNYAPFFPAEFYADQMDGLTGCAVGVGVALILDLL